MTGMMRTILTLVKCVGGDYQPSPLGSEAGGFQPARRRAAQPRAYPARWRAYHAFFSACFFAADLPMIPLKMDDPA